MVPSNYARWTRATSAVERYEGNIRNTPGMRNARYTGNTTAELNASIRRINNRSYSRATYMGLRAANGSRG